MRQGTSLPRAGRSGRPRGGSAQRSVQKDLRRGTLSVRVKPEDALERSNRGRECQARPLDLRPAGARTVGAHVEHRGHLLRLPPRRLARPRVGTRRRPASGGPAGWRPLHRSRAETPGPGRHRSWPRRLGQAGLTRAPGSGLPERTPHALRHTYASLHIAKAIEAGRDRDAILTYLRNQLRHRSIQTTMDYYIHLFPGGQREITNRLDDDTGQTWIPVVGSSVRRHREPSRTVPKPSRSAESSRSGSAKK
jgi:hypothetical protein